MDDWCKKENVHLQCEVKGHPQRMRCPDCKKRFKTFVRECDDPGCYHAYFPKHKKPKNKR